jgi:hypothetical protein
VSLALDLLRRTTSIDAASVPRAEFFAMTVLEKRRFEPYDRRTHPVRPGDGAMDQDGGERQRLFGEDTAKQMLWLPTTREETYAAKQAVDTFFVRCCDMLSAGVVFIGTHRLALSTTQFAATNVALVLISMVVAWLLLREYRRLTGVKATAAEPGAARLAEARS